MIKKADKPISGAVTPGPERLFQPGLLPRREDHVGSARTQLSNLLGFHQLARFSHRQFSPGERLTPSRPGDKTDIVNDACDGVIMHAVTQRCMR